MKTIDGGRVFVYIPIMDYKTPNMDYMTGGWHGLQADTKSRD